MPYTVRKTISLDASFEETYKSVYLSVQALKGKFLIHEPENLRLHVQMDKKLYKKILGDRSQLEIEFVSESKNKTTLNIIAFPVNPIGQKLMFGARKGVIPQVLEALETETQKRLDESE
ncbi:MAG: hypothetical protein N2D54_03805 [Chloroflexota bacterium]